MDVPASNGCVRMTNADVIDLFEQVAVGTRVHTVDGAPASPSYPAGTAP